MLILQGRHLLLRQPAEREHAAQHWPTLLPTIVLHLDLAWEITRRDHQHAPRSNQNVIDKVVNSLKFLS